jgi:transcriptional regulator with XRE-family HTH domain
MDQRVREKNLGEKITLFRLKKGLTQQKAADLYGCSLRWWQAIERGRNVSLFVLAKVAKVLTVEVWTLLKF